MALPSIGGVCAATGGTACAAAAVGAVGIGSYVLTDKYVNPWLQPVITRGIDACINSLNTCPNRDCNRILNESWPQGTWPADAGAGEWGRRTGVGAKDGRGRFHGIKQGNKGRPTDKYGVNPETGDVYDPNGEYVGNLNDAKRK